MLLKKLIYCTACAVTLTGVASPSLQTFAATTTDTTTTINTSENNSYNGALVNDYLQSAEFHTAMTNLKTTASSLMPVTDVATLSNSTQTLKELVNHGQLNVAGKDISVNFDKTNVYTSNASDSMYTYIHATLNGDNINHALSGITGVIDSNGNLVSYQENVVKASDTGMLKVDSFVNGRFLESRTSDSIPFLSDATFESGINRLEQIGSQATANSLARKKSTAACLAAVLGIGGTAAAFLAYACSGSCATALTNPGSATVCAACIGGAAVLGAGGMTAVVNCF